MVLGGFRSFHVLVTTRTEVDHKTLDSDLALKFFNRKIMREMIKI